MRAALLEAWPDLSHFFGIRPWETGRLRPAEIRVYLDALDQVRKQRKG